MMKPRSGIFSLLIVGVVFLHSNAQKCDLSDRKADVDFPDIWKYASSLSYELGVEFSMPKEEQFDFVKEYYSKSYAVGRVEYYTEGRLLIHHYSELTDESFNVEDGECKSMDKLGTPEYKKYAMSSDWSTYGTDGQPLVKGPSAMLFHAQKAFENAKDNTKTGYMGKVADRIRGINAQYWRRCADDFQFDYYFSTKDNDGAFDLDSMQIYPLRIVINKDGNDDTYPQICDIVTFQPDITDMTKLQVPTGVGCERGDEVDKPDMPDIQSKNFFTFGEVVYKDFTEKAVYDYMSSFMIAQSVKYDHIAYAFTPWGEAKRGKKTEAAGYTHLIFDTKKKYLYTNDLFNDKCEITREKSFYPTYVFPDGNGYIGFTDKDMLFPNDEFNYISDGVDRNMAVNIFEAVFDGYLLGNRSVSKAIVTRSFLKDNIEEENNIGIKNAITSINMALYNDKGAKENVLTVNFFGFTTRLDYEEQIFDVTPCFKKNDDSLWITLGFPADPATLQKMNNVIPSIEMEFRSTITKITEINPLRFPTVLVGFQDMLYISFVLLDKPQVMLDFLKPEPNTVIDTDEAEGIKSFDGCAVDCLENVNGCWGFSLCGATCYFGKGTNAVKPKEGCELYRRYDNDTFVNSKEYIKNNLMGLVKSGQFMLSVKLADVEQPLDLKATYFDSISPGESDEIFGLVGLETNPRLRVVKVGSKLDPKAGDTVKNFGKLRYDECQRICLDYQACETVSYCLEGACILSITYGEEIPKDQILEDNLCNLLTRTYADQFTKSAGLVLSQTAQKTLSAVNEEDCARSCARETSFLCQSFDSCRAEGAGHTCRLHAVHYLDLDNKETSVNKETTCGHYSRKFTYGFRKESSKRVTNAGSYSATNITLEECAKLCFEYSGGVCYGYDYCEDKTITSSSCTILNIAPSDMKVIYSPICNHFLHAKPAAPSGPYSKSTAAWVGIVCFVVSVVVGVALTFGIGYWRANRAR